MRNVQIVELAAVVVADQAGHLLVTVGFELHDGLGVIAVRLLSPGHERLPEMAAQRFAAVKAEKAGASGEAKQLFRPRGAQPLKIQRKSRTFEVLALG